MPFNGRGLYARVGLSSLRQRCARWAFTDRRPLVGCPVADRAAAGTSKSPLRKLRFALIDRLGSGSLLRAGDHIPAHV